MSTFIINIKISVPIETRYGDFLQMSLITQTSSNVVIGNTQFSGTVALPSSDNISVNGVILNAIAPAVIFWRREQPASYGGPWSSILWPATTQQSFGTSFLSYSSGVWTNSSSKTILIDATFQLATNSGSDMEFDFRATSTTMGWSGQLIGYTRIGDIGNVIVCNCRCVFLMYPGDTFWTRTGATSLLGYGSRFFCIERPVN